MTIWRCSVSQNPSQDTLFNHGCQTSAHRHVGLPRTHRLQTGRQLRPLVITAIAYIIYMPRRMAAFAASIQYSIKDRCITRAHIHVDNRPLAPKTRIVYIAATHGAIYSTQLGHLVPVSLGPLSQHAEIDIRVQQTL